MQVFEDCRQREIPLDFYGRHDYSVPVHPSVLKWFIDAVSPNLCCWLVNEYYHPKIIWWVGAGAYIGSANLTPRAWERNIEAGVFLSEDELTGGTMGAGLAAFFASLAKIATPLRRDIWLDQHNQLEFLKGRVQQADAEAREHFDKRNRVPTTVFPWLGAEDGPFQQFENEWNAAAERLEMIGKRVSADGMRPGWIREDVPPYVQGDQFLHDYYQRNVRSEADAKALYEVNQVNRERALVRAMQDWHDRPEADAAAEAEHMHAWAPLVAELCRKDRILTLARDEVVDLLLHVHAARDHVSHGRLEFMPKDAAQRSIEERVALLADFLLAQKSKCGWGVLQVIHYVAWGEDGRDSGPITRRLWRATAQDARLKHLAIGILGELVGWARADKYPPRNGRTSKALLALGTHVNISL